MNSWASFISASSFSGVSSRPCGSRNVAPIPFNRYKLISREIKLDMSKYTPYGQPFPVPVAEQGLDRRTGNPDYNISISVRYPLVRRKRLT